MIKLTKSRIICLIKHQEHLLTNSYEKNTTKKIPGQTVDKTIAKPVDTVNNQGETIICNKAMY